MTVHGFTYTSTHTATHLTDVIMGTLAAIIGDLGLDPRRLTGNWERDEKALRTWISEESLDYVRLECTQPGGKVSPVIEFPVKYEASGGGDAAFAASTARMLRFLSKLDRVPAGTSTRLLVAFRSARTPMPGWTSAVLNETAGMRTTQYGRLATGPGAQASLRIHE